MRPSPRPFAHLLLLAALVAAGAPAADLPIVHGEPGGLAKTLGPRTGALKLASIKVEPVATLAWAAPSEAQIEALRAMNRATKARLLYVGFGREPDEAMAREALLSAARWVTVSGGRALQLRVVSTGASALRVALDVSRLPAPAQLRFGSSRGVAVAEEPVTVGELRTPARYWTPVTHGESQLIEIFLPDGVSAEAASVRIEGVSHLLASPLEGFKSAKIGEAGSCNFNTICIQPSAAYDNARNSVARMVFTLPGGGSAFCTGTLLNDTDTRTQIPYFYSANHCFDNSSAPYRTPAEMQTVASTLNTFWFYESTTCPNPGTLNPAFVQRVGGATLLYNNVDTDVLFLRLNEAAPAGAFFSASSPNTIGVGESTLAIHHPRADLKKVSLGTTQGFGDFSLASTPTSFILMQWSQGTTEPGSSGSGFWTASTAEYVFRGGLQGGAASCDNPTGIDMYSRFDRAFAAIIGRYLIAPSADYTDLWWNASESGWGLNLIQHASNQIFGVWYSYGADGKRTWIALPGGTWSAANVFTGALYTTSGPPFDRPFDATRVSKNHVGSATLTFSDANNATFAYTISGQSGVKVISRQPF